VNLPRLRERIIKHEGIRLKPYRDSLGYLTIGIGRCLDKKGISQTEANILLLNDINDSLEAVRQNISFYNDLDDLRQEILVEMCFQMGTGGLLGFKKFLKHLKDGEYDKASKEMLRSDWAFQTPNRAQELADIMKGDL
jgi:lysozyme